MTRPHFLSARLPKLATSLAAIIVAATLLFSGLVKAVDPAGMCIKLNAYLSHFGFYLPDDALLLWLAVAALALFEFTLGLNLLLGIRRRLSTALNLLFILFLTGLTLWTYLADPVADCGCFGDAITLTHGQTLAKNIVLLCLSAWLAWKPLRLPRLLTEHSQWLANVYGAVFLIALIVYSFYRLPLVDFTDFKLGRSMREALFNPEAEESFTDLANLLLLTEEGEMVQDSLLLADGYIFFLTLPDEARADDGIADRINDISDYCADHSIPFCALLPQEQAELARDWSDRTGATYPFLTAESTLLKAMVRANPGLMMLRDGRIAAKWGTHDFPVITDDTDLSLLVQENNGPRRLAGQIAWLVIPILLLILLQQAIRRIRKHKRTITLKQTNQQ